MFKVCACNCFDLISFASQTRTVQVGNISELAGEREVAEFFSFSGEIERVEIVRR